MAGVLDKFYDLAIVDPPYGIGDNWNKSKNQQFYGHKNNFNQKPPDKNYFKELFRISKHQIIWGANYYCHYLPMSNNWIFWDKIREVKKTFMSEGELAWTSFPIPMRKIRIIWNGGKKGIETGIKTIHPHQKPITLYKWLLKNYAQPGWKIFDSHVGSGSIRIACHDMGFYFEGCEIDPDYHRDQEIRFQNHVQDELWNKQEIQELIYEEKELIV